MDRLQSSGTGEACAEAQARMEQGKSQSRRFLHSAVTAEGQSRAAQYLWGLGKKHYFHFEREARVGSGEHN